MSETGCARWRGRSGSPDSTPLDSTPLDSTPLDSTPLDSTPQRPWYGGGLAFQCTGCGDCCSGEPGAVWLNDEEIALLARHLELSAVRFEQQYVRRLGARRSLHERASGDCVFFDPEQRICIVYPARPVQCRTYPFWNALIKDEQSWAAVQNSCKGARQRQSSVDAADIGQRAEQLRRARAGEQ